MRCLLCSEKQTWVNRSERKKKDFFLIFSKHNLKSLLKGSRICSELVYINLDTLKIIFLDKSLNENILLCQTLESAYNILPKID